MPVPYRSRRGRTLSLLAMVVAALVLALPGAASAATKTYLQIDGIDGGSTSARYAGAIDVLAFSWGASRANDRRTFQDVSVQKHVDAASVALYQHLATARVARRAVLTVTEMGAEAREVARLRYCMDNVQVTSMQQSGSSEMNESVSLKYGTFTMVTFGEREDPLGSFGWDLVRAIQYGAAC